MYPVGLMFGLGFDTATEIAVLILAAGAAGAGLRSTLFCASPSCSQRECRCWTRSTAGS
jgi:high-affinity nickel permease